MIQLSENCRLLSRLFGLVAFIIVVDWRKTMIRARLVE